MVKRTFVVVAEGLFRIGLKTGLTYNEVNILVYYFIIPLTWTVMFDVLIKMPIATSVLVCIWIGIFMATRHRFREWCDWVFMKSVDFLNWFNRFGGNYVLNSVIICVVVPLIVYGLLIWLLINS